MILHIKNMVCARCKWMVEKLLHEQGFAPLSVELGEVEIGETPMPVQLQRLAEALREHGFELLEDRQSRLVEQVKNLIVSEIHHSAGKKPNAMNFSDFLARETGHDYSQLSKLFSSVEGLTIEKYVIAQKIERVKELLVYGEQTLSEIAWQTGYSSTQHLSNQFRQVTGVSPTEFKAVHWKHGRKPLDAL
jgi:AraC family transcriptional regulator